MQMSGQRLKNWGSVPPDEKRFTDIMPLHDS